MSGPLRVVIYGVNYAPERTGIGPYTAELAEALAARGHQVRAIVGVPHYPEWTTSTSAFGASETTVENGVMVTRVPLYMPKHVSPRARALFELSFMVRARLVRTGRTDVALGVVPAFTGLVLAKRKRSRRRVVLFQDLVGRGLVQSGLARNQRLSSAVEHYEARLANLMDAVCVIAPSFGPSLIAAGVSEQLIRHTPNWPRVQASGGLAVAADQILGTRPTDRVLLHSGSMGPKQGLMQLIEAARASVTRRPDLVWAFTGDGSDRMRLLDAAAGLPNVRFCPVLADGDFADVLARADALLVSQSATNQDMSMPSKLWTYFNAGRPIVAAVPPLGSCGGFLQSVGAAVVVGPDDADTLLAAASAVIDDAALADRLVANARHHLSERTDARFLIDELIEAVIGDPMATPREIDLRHLLDPVVDRRAVLRPAG
jgi:colanic acid biosynthesis glycosyl transferase WcaI